MDSMVAALISNETREKLRSMRMKNLLDGRILTETQRMALFERSSDTVRFLLKIYIEKNDDLLRIGGLLDGTKG